MSCQRRENIARRSSWYICEEVYQLDGRARTLVGLGFGGGDGGTGLPKPR